MTDTATRHRDRTEFLPKLLTVWREGYGLSQLKADALAGLTVAIVALPLSMAIAIASGVGPERGLYTAIVGGFLVSALGGSRYQIGGPAGAFIVLVSACVMATGLQGLILATFLSGLILIAAGALRLGTYIRYIPYPVTVGFTAGIAVIIFASQLREIFGLTLTGGEPAAILPKIEALWAARETVTPAAVVVAVVTAGLILGLRRVRPHWPGMLIAIALAGTLAALFQLPVATIGSRFGELPHFLPMPALPDLSLWQAALPWAISFALSGRLNRSSPPLSPMECPAHGTGRMRNWWRREWRTSARRSLAGSASPGPSRALRPMSGRAAGGPVSGMLHALFLLVFMAVAAPLAAYIPLAALAGVLAVVAWGMAERHEFAALLRSSWGDALVVSVTFLLVVFRDLTEGIVVGFALAGLVFIKRMSESAAMRPREEELTAPRADRVVYHLEGPYFFGAAAQLGGILDRIAEAPRALVLDMSGVPLIDSSGARGFHSLAARARKRGGRLFLVGLRAPLRHQLEAQGLGEPEVTFLPDLAAVDRLLDAGSEST